LACGCCEGFGLCDRLPSLCLSFRSLSHRGDWRLWGLDGCVRELGTFSGIFVRFVFLFSSIFPLFIVYSYMLWGILGEGMGVLRRRCYIGGAAWIVVHISEGGMGIYHLAGVWASYRAVEKMFIIDDAKAKIKQIKKKKKKLNE